MSGYTTTPNYGLKKPVENADDDAWGGHINSTMDTIDGVLKTNADRGAQALNGTGRNLIHNSMFNIQQRGVGPFATTSAYTVDRWQTAFVTDTNSFLAFPINDTDRAQIGDESAQWLYGNNFIGNAAVGAFSVAYHRIEDVRRLAGKTVTLSFYAQASAALKLGVSMDQSFGNGGSPSVPVLNAGQSVQLSNTWARYSVTFPLASVAGKTMGTNGDSNTSINFWYSSGVNQATRAGNPGVQSGIINLWGVQLEVGSVATPLEKPDPRYDLANCQRFYATGNVSLYAYNTAGSYVTQMVSLPVPMRASPTIVPTLIPTNLNTVSMDMQSNYQPRVVGVVTAIGNCSVLGTFTASADL